MPHKDKIKHNAYMRLYMNQRYEARKQEAISFLGDKCVKCGSYENLEFDHIDPCTKSFTICKYGVSCSYEKFWEEVNKCQLLCKDCHRLKHAAPHGSAGRYKAGCRCECCKKYKRLAFKEYRKRKLGSVI